jgi:hypothetical protein
MTKQNKRALLIVLGVVLLLAMSSEFASMASQIGIWDALGSFALLTLIVLGIVYWIKRSKK